MNIVLNVCFLRDARGLLWPDIGDIRDSQINFLFYIFVGYWHLLHTYNGSQNNEYCFWAAKGWKQALAMDIKYMHVLYH